jgi:hypothetical protein
VNEYIREHRISVPAWIDEVTPEDVAALEEMKELGFDT